MAFGAESDPSSSSSRQFAAEWALPLLMGWPFAAEFDFFSAWSGSFAAERHVGVFAVCMVRWRTCLLTAFYSSLMMIAFGGVRFFFHFWAIVGVWLCL